MVSMQNFIMIRSVCGPSSLRSLVAFCVLVLSLSVLRAHAAPESEDFRYGTTLVFRSPGTDDPLHYPESGYGSGFSNPVSSLLVCNAAFNVATAGLWMVPKFGATQIQSVPTDERLRELPNSYRREFFNFQPGTFGENVLSIGQPNVLITSPEDACSGYFAHTVSNAYGWIGEVDLCTGTVGRTVELPPGLLPSSLLLDTTSRILYVGVFAHGPSVINTGEPYGRIHKVSLDQFDGLSSEYFSIATLFDGEVATVNHAFSAQWMVLDSGFLFAMVEQWEHDIGDAGHGGGSGPTILHLKFIRLDPVSLELAGDPSVAVISLPRQLGTISPYPYVLDPVTHNVIFALHADVFKVHLGPGDQFSVITSFHIPLIEDLFQVTVLDMFLASYGNYLYIVSERHVLIYSRICVDNDYYIDQFEARAVYSLQSLGIPVRDSFTVVSAACSLGDGVILSVPNLGFVRLTVDADRANLRGILPVEPNTPFPLDSTVLSAIVVDASLRGIAISEDLEVGYLSTDGVQFADELAGTSILAVDLKNMKVVSQLRLDGSESILGGADVVVKDRALLILLSLDSSGVLLLRSLDGISLQVNNVWNIEDDVPAAASTLFFAVKNGRVQILLAKPSSNSNEPAGGGVWGYYIVDLTTGNVVMHVDESVSAYVTGVTILSVDDQSNSFLLGRITSIERGFNSEPTFVVGRIERRSQLDISSLPTVDYTFGLQYGRSDILLRQSFLDEATGVAFVALGPIFIRLNLADNTLLDSVTPVVGRPDLVTLEVMPSHGTFIPTLPDVLVQIYNPPQWTMPSRNGAVYYQSQQRYLAYVYASGYYYPGIVDAHPLEGINSFFVHYPSVDGYPFNIVLETNILLDPTHGKLYVIYATDLSTASAITKVYLSTRPNDVEIRGSDHARLGNEASSYAFGPAPLQSFSALMALALVSSLSLLLC